jgi:hypothetical protein
MADLVRELAPVLRGIAYPVLGGWVAGYATGWLLEQVLR